MKKRPVQILGIIVILIGIVFLINSFQITGFVVLKDVGRTAGSVFGIVFVIGGILLFMAGRHEGGSGGLELIAEDGIAAPSTTAERLNRITPKTKKTLVLDTSFIRAYTAAGADALFKHLKGYDAIIVPKAVYDELGSSRFNDLKKVLSKYKAQEPLEEFTRYRKVARDYIEQTNKHMYNEEIIPIILKEKSSPKSRREAAPLIEETKKLLGYMAQKRAPITRENLIRESERHHRASDADVDVLASALAEAGYTKGDVVIGEKDTHLRDAVDMIKKRKDSRGREKRTGKLLHYVEPYA